MSQRFEGDTGRYVAVLRGFGLTDSEIRRLHDGQEKQNAQIGSIVAEYLDDDPSDALVETICQSPYGVDLPRFYSSPDAADELETVANAHGYDATVEPRGGRAFSITLTDSLSGQTDEFEIEYPETQLGPDNFPAIVAAVERVVFEDAGLRFVLLDSEDRWRIALVERSAMEGLVEQFGRRVEAFDRPILSRARPVDYVVDPPLPGSATTESLETPSDDDLEAWLEAVTDRPTETVIENLKQSGATEAIIESLKESGPRETVSEREIEDANLPESAEDDPIVESGGPRTHVSSGTDDVFDELDDTDDPAGLGSGPTKTVSTEGIDDVFEELEEQAPEPEGLGPKTERVESDDPTEAVDADESDATESDQSGPLGGGPDRTVSDTSVDDILEEAEESFATFTGEGADTYVEPDPDSLLPDTEDDDVMSAVEAVEPEHEPGQAELDPDDADEAMADFFEQDDPETGSDTSGGRSPFDDGPELDQTIGLSERVSERLSDDPEQTEATTATDHEDGAGAATEDQDRTEESATEEDRTEESATEEDRTEKSATEEDRTEESATEEDRTEESATEEDRTEESATIADESTNPTTERTPEVEAESGDASGADSEPDADGTPVVEEESSGNHPEDDTDADTGSVTPAPPAVESSRNGEDSADQSSAPDLVDTETDTIDESSRNGRDAGSPQSEDGSASPFGEDIDLSEVSEDVGGDGRSADDEGQDRDTPIADDAGGDRNGQSAADAPDATDRAERLDGDTNDWRTGPSAFEVGGERDEPDVLDLSAGEYDVRQETEDQRTDDGSDQQNSPGQTDGDGSEPRSGVGDEDHTTDDDEDSVVDRFRSMVGR